MFQIGSERMDHASQKVKYHMDNTEGMIQLAGLLADSLIAVQGIRPLALLCIGTDRSTGDCLGPLVGSKLQAACTGLTVYGTLQEPVHASNLQQTLSELGHTCPSAYIIAIDACLGSLESLGYISLCKGALKPGAGVHKTLPPVGDIHLTGIVNVGGFMEYLVLQNTRLSYVMKMADSISQVVQQAVSFAQSKGQSRLKL